MILSIVCPYCGNEVEAEVFFVPAAEPAQDGYSLELLESFCECDDRKPMTLALTHTRLLIAAYDLTMRTPRTV